MSHPQAFRRRGEGKTEQPMAGAGTTQHHPPGERARIATQSARAKVKHLAGCREIRLLLLHQTQPADMGVSCSATHFLVATHALPCPPDGEASTWFFSRSSRPTTAAKCPSTLGVSCPVSERSSRFGVSTHVRMVAGVVIRVSMQRSTCCECYSG